MDYKQNLNIDAWHREAALATEFRKRGYTVTLPPVCLANEHADISSFREDCDLIVTKGTKSWKVMHKSIETLNQIDHDDPINSLQSIDLDEHRIKSWGDKGERRVPLDPTWRNKFWPFCTKEEIPSWYGERLWAVSDQDVTTTFFFKGSDVLNEDLKITYYGDQQWNFMPITNDTKYWSSSYVPYLDEPWPQ